MRKIALILCFPSSDMSKVQDDEVGDGTTSVTVLAAELLRVMYYIFADVCQCTSVIPPVGVVLSYVCERLPKHRKSSLLCLFC